MLTPSLEDYVEEIYNLSTDRKSVRSKDLAERLNVSMPAVTKALHRLNGTGYVIYKVYGSIILTELGREVGAYLKRRNRILKDFITLLGVDCNVDIEVESLEHYISPQITHGVERLLQFLDEGSIRTAYIEFCTTESEPPFVTALGSELRQMRRFGGKPQK